MLLQYKYLLEKYTKSLKNIVNVTIYGKTQNVKLIHYIKIGMKKYKITGWIKNNKKDNIVKCELKGSHGHLLQLLDYIQKGDTENKKTGDRANIKKIEVHWKNKKNKITK